MSFSATDNIWPETARGHLARGRISGQRPCDRPRTVSSKARGPTKESKQRQGPSLFVIKFVWDYWRLQLIVIQFVSRVIGGRSLLLAGSAGANGPPCRRALFSICRGCNRTRPWWFRPSCESCAAIGCASMGHKFVPIRRTPTTGLCICTTALWSCQRAASDRLSAHMLRRSAAPLCLPA